MKQLEVLHRPVAKLVISEQISVCFEDIPGFAHWREMRLIRRRSKHDLLFYIREDGGSELALRIMAEHSYDYYCSCFHFQKQINRQLKNDDSIVSDDGYELRFGVCGKSQVVYFLMCWQHDRCFNEIVHNLSFHDKIRPAAAAAAHLKAVEKIVPREGLVRFSDSDEDKWFKHIEKRYKMVRSHLKYYNRDIAAFSHFEQYYQTNKHLLSGRSLAVCYKSFCPGSWYYQTDGTVRVPLITEWIRGDSWYSLNRLFTDIHTSSEDLAVLLVDSYFDFDPPEEFFACCVIYSMLQLLEELVCQLQSGNTEAQPLLRRIRAIDRMFGRFTVMVPQWYKKIELASLFDS
ncbi:MAG: hypothetical protein PWP10_3765 [Clostridiales bacterium]|jgi:hypothetical protein|nr:hypothetical protein [Clostridiales bacterium]